MKNSKKIMAAALALAIMLVGCANNKNATASADVSETSAAETVITETTTAVTAASVDELNEFVAKDVENTISALYADYEDLKTNIDTYDKYLASIDKMEAFYTKVYETNNSLCFKMRKYSLDYAELIIASNLSNDDKYDELDELYDNVYEDAADEIYDGIYDGILADMYDDFYGGILHDAYRTASYDEWSEALSDEYDLWSDTKSDVYDDWSDYRSDVYDFWSDVRSEIYSDDMDRAKKKIADFRDDLDNATISKLDSNVAKTSLDDVNSISPETNITTALETKTAENNVNNVDGMRSDFKEAMDSYEEFMDEYVAFMKKFSESDGTDLSILNDYSKYMTKYLDMVDKFDKWESEDLNTAETAYYSKVQLRVSKKLLDAVQ